jgi:hypothetical protein
LDQEIKKYLDEFSASPIDTRRKRSANERVASNWTVFVVEAFTQIATTEGRETL